MTRLRSRLTSVIKSRRFFFFFFKRIKTVSSDSSQPRPLLCCKNLNCSIKNSFVYNNCLINRNDTFSDWATKRYNLKAIARSITPKNLRTVREIYIFFLSREGLNTQNESTNVALLALWKFWKPISHTILHPESWKFHHFTTHWVKLKAFNFIFISSQPRLLQDFTKFKLSNNGV